MRPVLFDLFGWPVPAYGATLVVVFLTGLVLVYRANRHLGVTAGHMLDLATIVATAIIGWLAVQFLAKTVGLRSGITFNTLPTLALGSVGFLLYFRAKSLPAEKLFDNVAPIAIGGIALQYAVGTFLAGTAHGRATQTGLEVAFAAGSPAYRAYGGSPVFPLQLVIGAGFAAIAACAWTLRGRMRDGAVALSSFVAVGIWYLLTSPFRGNTTSLLRLEGPRLSEVVAVGIVIFSSIMLVRLLYKHPSFS